MDQHKYVDASLNAPNTRFNNNTKTTFAFAESKPVQNYDMHSQENRQKQFKDTPLQPGATRQSF